MAKTLSKDKAQLVQEYAYYVGLHSQAETYLLWSISDAFRYADGINNGAKDIQQENINRARWAAQAAMTAARCLGLSEDFISNALLSRANTNDTDEA